MTDIEVSYTTPLDTTPWRMVLNTDGWMPGWVAAEGSDAVPIDYRVQDGRVEMRRRTSSDDTPPTSPPE